MKHAGQPASLWRNRNYLLLWAGQIVSTIGTQVSDLAFPLLVLALTNSPAQAGYVGSLGMLPYLVFSLPAGALADRWNRKLVMLLCDSGRALSLASIPITYAFGRLTVVQLYLVSLIEGTLFVFFNLAEVACLPQLVRKEHYPTVAAQTEFTQSISFLLGRSLGGILYSLGRFVPFLADALSYMISVLSLCFVRLPAQPKPLACRRSLGAEIWEGLRWLWHQPLLCFIAILGCVVHIAGSGMVLIVIVVAQHAHTAPFFIGLILGVGSIGTVLGAFLGGILQKRFSFAQMVFSTQWLSALLFPLYILAPGVAWLSAVILVIYAAMSTFGVVQLSYRLARIPSELQGRVNSVYRLIVFAGDPLGLALTGLLLQVSGVQFTVIAFTLLLIAVAFVTTFNPQLRHTNVATNQ